MARRTKDERRQMRIDVANDVLKHLHALQISTGTYVMGKIPATLTGDEDAQEHLPIIRKECRVCAKGAMVLSYIGLYDKLRLNDIFDIDDESYEGKRLVDAEDGQLCEILETGFDKDDLNKIEAAFELWTTAETICDDNAPYHFGKQYDYNPVIRLQAIMQNVVDNNGDFHPEVVYVAHPELLEEATV